ncbi:MAG TPA: PIN domain-containing protein [Thermomicrobiales bacterium]|nr:PIN domain-containing protein [Thermomicrobiales bacterium]
MTMPDGCVVDTDVLSYLFRRDTRAERFRPYLTGRIPTVSIMTLAELQRWALHRNWGQARREQLAAFLEPFAITMADYALCLGWAEVMDGARRRGRPIQTADAWIAATALALGVPLMTNNRDDFAGVPNLTFLPETAPV